MINIVTIFLAVLTVLAQVLALAFLVELIRSKGRGDTPLVRRVRQSGPALALFVAGVATLGSLFFSEIAFYEPCKLCWLQRIFMYPQAVILAVALWRKDVGVFAYTLVLSLIGIVIATYHYAMQIGLVPVTTCSAVGHSVSCADVFTTTFGYITIPMMALTAFVLLLLISIISRRP